MAFDHLLTCCIGYRDLDDRLRLTITKRHALLRVRGEPTLPLTNNPPNSPFVARTQARRQRRRLLAELKTWDMLQTIIAT